MKTYLPKNNIIFIPIQFSHEMECSLGRVGECKAVGDDFQENVSVSRIASIHLSSKWRGDGPAPRDGQY